MRAFVRGVAASWSCFWFRRCRGCCLLGVVCMRMRIYARSQQVKASKIAVAYRIPFRRRHAYTVIRSCSVWLLTSSKGCASLTLSLIAKKLFLPYSLFLVLVELLSLPLTTPARTPSYKSLFSFCFFLVDPALDQVRVELSAERYALVLALFVFLLCLRVK
jgi:hypothetical protein